VAGEEELARELLRYAHVPGDAVPPSLRHLLGPWARPDLQAQQAGLFVVHALRTGDPAVLDASILLHEAALPADLPNPGATFANAAAGYWARHERTGNAADLDRAIDLGSYAAARFTADPNHPTILSNLGTAHWARYELASRPDDLDTAIDILGRAVAAAAPGDPNRPVVLSNLATAHLSRFERTDNPADLDRAIDIGHAVVDAAAAPDPVTLSNLGMAHRARYERTGSTADLDTAIECGRRALAAGPPSVRLPTLLSNLGIACHDRFTRRGDFADLDDAIGYQEQAVAATPSGHTDRPLYLNNAATAYRERFARTGDLGDLDHAIAAADTAVAACGHRHPRLALCLDTLGGALSDRFERTGRGDDLDRAIRCKEHAVVLAPDSLRANSLSNLSHTYRLRFGRTGDLADLDRAVDTAERAVAATPVDHPDLAVRLNNLGLTYGSRFERTGRTEDLDRAIGHQERAAAATPDDLPGLAMVLSNLALSYQRRFDRTGAPDDLDRAVAAATRALAATPADHPDLGIRLTNSAAVHRARYEHRGDTADLDRVVAHHERAFAVFPADHPSRARAASNLTVAYRLRYRRTGDGAELDRAADVGRQAVAATPVDGPDFPLRLGNLASVLLARYRHSGAAADLDEAIAHQDTALAAVPADHPDRARHLSDLSVLLQAKAARTGAAEDRARGLALVTESVAATPGDHAQRAKRLRNYALMLERRGDVTATEAGMLAAHVFAARQSPPADQVGARWVAGRVAHTAGEDEIARRLLDAAVELLPSVPARETSHLDQEHRLDGHLGLVGEAVAVHCALGDPAGAVRVAEQGRGILLAAQLDARTDVSGLETGHPELARRFRAVRTALGSGDGPDADHRRRLWTEHDELLAHIRGLPGWDRFLLPPAWEELRPAAAGGTAVLVNAGSTRADAVLVTEDADPVLVPLPALTLDDLDTHTLSLQRVMAETGLTARLRRQRVLTELLGWLWDTAVGPILDHVDSRRVWWLPTGLLGQLPLHAAGHPGQPGALDRVVSSYTPTLRALRHSRNRPAATADRRLTVAMTSTPGMADLPATVEEAAALRAETVLRNENATVDAVLRALPEVSTAHFACHASTDPAAPSRGGLHLHDGVLPITEISRLRLAAAELAYLSACSTGQVSRRHANESTHLASAFQLAGFRHVIASLWPLEDTIAATAADRFHRLTTPPAEALHEVTLSLRADTPAHPHRWAPLIHSGP
jgi:tetratricopeptide (TPR) repeat protein